MCSETICSHGIGLGLLEAQRDTLTVAVYVEDLDLDLLIDLQHLGGVVDVRPGELRDVDQTVDAVEVDEGAEIDDLEIVPSTTSTT